MTGGGREVVVDDRLADALRALLAIPPAHARAVRERTRARPHPRPQRGPSADYGDGPS